MKFLDKSQHRFHEKYRFSIDNMTMSQLLTHFCREVCIIPQQRAQAACHHQITAFPFRLRISQARLFHKGPLPRWLVAHDIRHGLVILVAVVPAGTTHPLKKTNSKVVGFFLQVAFTTGNPKI